MKSHVIVSEQLNITEGKHLVCIISTIEFIQLKF